MTDLQLAIKLNGGFRPLSFKLYDDGHMVIITHQGTKVSIAKDIVSKTRSEKDKDPGARSGSQGTAPASQPHGAAQAAGPAHTAGSQAGAPATSPPEPSPRGRGDKRGGSDSTSKSKPKPSALGSRSTPAGRRSKK